MTSPNRPLNDVFLSLCKLAKSKGYLYVLFFMFEDDLFVPVSQIGEANPRLRLSVKEAAMLLGVFIKEGKDYLEEPEDVNTLLQLRRETYRLLEEIHWAMNEPLAQKMREAVGRMNSGEEPHFPNEEELSQAIYQRESFFYSNEPAYDLEYLKFAPQKYKYDKEWLRKNKDFDCDEVSTIAINILKFLDTKIQGIQYVSKETVEEYVDKKRKLKRNPKSADKVRDYFALHKYEGLLSADTEGDSENLDRINCHELCEILLNLFTIDSEFCRKQKGIGLLFSNFSIEIKHGINANFTEPGKNNIISAKPIIKIDNRYLLPIPYLLFQSIYESPYYWLIEDAHYARIAGSHIGTASEDMVYNLLCPIFGIKNTYRNVLIKKNKETITDIDILCILDNKALCVQVKSKKLTEKAQIGDDSSYKRDFKGAISDAYNQGLICKKSILNKECDICISKNDKLNIQNIDEVFLLCVTTGFYSAIPNQVRLLLDLADEKTTPVVLNVFDLHLVTHYLTDSFEFLYYIRQRIATNDYYNANNETVLLSYHLSNKLWKNPQFNWATLDQSFANNIDVDYPNIFNIGASADNDTFTPTCKWLSAPYRSLLLEMRNCNVPRIVDMIFDMLDCSKESEILMKAIYDARKRSFSNHTIVSICMVFDGGKLGITYTASYSLSLDDLQNQMSVYSNYHKYKNKADKWIGIASCVFHPYLIEAIEYNTNPWVEDLKIEEEIKELESMNNPIFAVVPNKKKIGRNELCPCGSGLKYKYCHGKH